MREEATDRVSEAQVLSGENKQQHEGERTEKGETEGGAVTPPLLEAKRLQVVGKQEEEVGEQREENVVALFSPCGLGMGKAEKEGDTGAWASPPSFRPEGQEPGDEEEREEKDEGGKGENEVEECKERAMSDELCRTRGSREKKEDGSMCGGASDEREGGVYVPMAAEVQQEQQQEHFHHHHEEKYEEGGEDEDEVGVSTTAGSVSGSLVREEEETVAFPSVPSSSSSSSPSSSSLVTITIPAALHPLVEQMLENSRRQECAQHQHQHQEMQRSVQRVMECKRAALIPATGRSATGTSCDSRSKSNNSSTIIHKKKKAEKNKTNAAIAAASNHQQQQQQQHVMMEREGHDSSSSRTRTPSISSSSFSFSSKLSRSLPQAPPEAGDNKNEDLNISLSASSTCTIDASDSSGSNKNPTTSKGNNKAGGERKAASLRRSRSGGKAKSISSMVLPADLLDPDSMNFSPRTPTFPSGAGLPLGQNFSPSTYTLRFHSHSKGGRLTSPYAAMPLSPHLYAHPAGGAAAVETTAYQHLQEQQQQQHGYAISYHHSHHPAHHQRHPSLPSVGNHSHEHPSRQPVPDLPSIPPSNVASAPHMPSPVVPTHTTMGQEQVEELLRHQLHFYFSPDNLVKDFYLRGKMDSEGWVPFAEVAQFNRVKHLLGLLGMGGGQQRVKEGGKAAVTDLSLLIKIAADSDEVEVQMMMQGDEGREEGKDGKDGKGRLVYKVRPRHEPLRWILPATE